MKNAKFYICSHCRNTVEMIYDTDIKLKSRSIDKYFLIERLIIQLAEVG